MFKPRVQEQEQYQDNDGDNFLLGGGSSNSEGMKLESNEADNFLDSIEDECYEPDSPGYDPNSPRYSPSSP